MHRAQGHTGEGRQQKPSKPSSGVRPVQGPTQATVPVDWAQALPCSPPGKGNFLGAGLPPGELWSAASCCLSFKVIASVSRHHRPAAPAAPTLTGEIFWAIKACRAGQESSFGERRPACLSERDNRAVKFHLLYSAGSTLVLLQTAKLSVLTPH